MSKTSVGILHYAAPPVVGGVEAVIQAHANMLVEHGYPVTVIAGRGDAAYLPDGCDFSLIREVDSQHPEIARQSAMLEQGQVPPEFNRLRDQLAEILAPVLSPLDHVIVHNIWTKHFNLPLTAALHQLLDAGIIRHCIAWCHDFTWTSPNSRSKVFPGYPWELLRAYRQDVTFVAVSRRRQGELAGLLECPTDAVRVIYNGIDPQSLLGLSDVGDRLIARLGLLDSELTLLMPVRITQAKNIEYAMQVIRALKIKGCTACLVITGPPDPHDPQSMAYFSELQQLRERLGLDEQVRFVFEAGDEPDTPLFIEPEVVGDLFRVSDGLFMPSHREGFGMPILEAGLVGIPVICSGVPAAEEIGLSDVITFDPTDDPANLAETILACVTPSPRYRLRQRVRQSYTWEALFRNDIEPLLTAQKETSYAQP